MRVIIIKRISNRINEKYIRKVINQSIEPNKYATLPNKLSNIIGNIGKCHGLITDRTNAFVRRGIESNNQYFLSCLISLMNNDELKTLEDFYNLLDENMSILDYIELNNGNTLNLYLNTDKNIYDKENFKKFKEWLSNDKNKDYIKLMNLNDLMKHLKGLNSFVYEDDNMSRTILREYLIYNSFENFKYYLRSDLIKNHEEILQLFTNNYSWLNENEFENQNENELKGDWDYIKVRIIAEIANKFFGRTYYYKVLIMNDKTAQESLKYFNEAKTLLN